DGTLGCTIPNADFYFINPAGVMFGPNAALDLKGSLAVTTADYLKLAASGRFDANKPSNDVLTAAAPVAFGFLNASPAAITVRGVGQQASTLSLSAGRSLAIAG